VGERFFWYWPAQVVPDKGPLNGCVCYYLYALLIAVLVLQYVSVAFANLLTSMLDLLTFSPYAAQQQEPMPNLSRKPTCCHCQSMGQMDRHSTIL